MPLRPILLVGLLVGSLPAAGQALDSTAAGDGPAARPGGLDARLFYAVYDTQSPAFEALMRTANSAATPLFALAVPVSGLGALATGESAAATGRLALSEIGAFGVIALGKFTIRRARPHAALPDVVPRQRRPPSGLDPYSFPSGHSALAFAIATSTSLSYPEWYVIVPAYLWATSTATARLWFGMHYPSDTVVGALAGSGVALLVHALTTGEDAEPDAALGAGPAFAFRIGL